MSGQEILRPTFPTIVPPPYPKLTYGIPFFDATAKQVKELFNAQRPYIIASNTLSKRTKFLTQLQDALGSSLVGTWIGIPNHTPVQALIPIIEDIRAKDADIIITLGGGSISDGAKLISLALANNITSTAEMPRLPHLDAELSPVAAADIVPPKIPVICIPISLSGGEYSRFAGVTDLETSHKGQYTHEKMYPSLIVLDPQLTMSTPLSVWLSSGVRSIDHCVEGYCSKNASPEGDAAAKEALTLLVKGLLQTEKDETDQEARLLCQLGSNLSMTLLMLGILKGASHGIGHQLGPLGVAHGDTSCILLPAVCKYNAPVNKARQEDLKKLLSEQPDVKAVLATAGIQQETSDLGDVLRAIFNHLGMPRCLKDVGIGGDKIQVLATLSMDEVYVKSNPRSMTTQSDVLELLEMVVE